MNPPVSVKGVVTVDGRVVLLRNDRDEWELPGGRIDPGESERDALAREVREELGLDVEVLPDRLDRYDFAPIPDRVVTIVTYGCVDRDGIDTLAVSDEHLEVATFVPEVAGRLPDLPEGYRASIRRHLLP